MHFSKEMLPKVKRGLFFHAVYNLMMGTPGPGSTESRHNTIGLNIIKCIEQ